MRVAAGAMRFHFTGHLRPNTNVIWPSPGGIERSDPADDRGAVPGIHGFNAGSRPGGRKTVAPDIR